MPFNDAVDTAEFKTWLVATIEPLCDADPIVMSDYIIALLKHDAVMAEDEWKIFVSRELEDFLEDNSKTFVEILFKTLADKSYLPQAAPPPTAPAIVSSYRPHASLPSSEPEAGPSTTRPSNLGQGELQKQDVDMGDATQPVQGNGQHSRPQRQKCFDYHERGFCMRGNNCPYEHSDDVIIPTPEMMFAGQFPPPMMGGPPGRGRGLGRGRGRGRGMGGSQQNGNGHMMAPGPGPGQQFPPQMPFPFPFPFPGMPGQMNQNQNQHPNIPNEYMGSNRPPSTRDINTLVITDIPQASLSVQAIRDYFQKFGEVTNVAIEGRSKRALISFEDNRQAFQAWKSDEAVFGSRHVKVLWHKPRPGQGGAGHSALEKSAELLANMKKLESGEGIQGDVKVKLSGPESRLKATLAELENTEKRAKKETLMAEQKVLFSKTTNASKEEKIQILGRLKEISKDLEAINNPPKVEPEDAGFTEKEILDAELAKHGMETTEGKDQAELLRLSAQLSALRDKASTLGINSSARFSPYSRGGLRGRGYTSRGRGRGRGAARGPMRLDNRSRTITVSGEAVSSDESRKAVQDWYESQGGVTELVDGGLRVTYPARDMAEKVLALGTKDIGGISGAININWYNAPLESTAPDVEMMAEDEPVRGERHDED
ncbi:uncharacterized protein I303_100649 [Kwoniella dejecticola CBS 10117]|uniref:C3H1-type domain-containing protein n=1 Tax=Kwoniella dejecticola CBS 10117 TaxID=1296121 RepID=A0A1A6AFK1_9TREE|nr:uncharacterized protein I303_00653 [Kwoniella dejecticola CBS 10117]OBR88836.1 hypothetical protein I303_00653 [Kwoniella dejecticola CBS 10117]